MGNRKEIGGLMSNEYLILYDGTCGLCHRSIRFLLERDSDHHFLFAPLQGETAQQWRKELEGKDEVVLVAQFNTKIPVFFTGIAAVKKVGEILGGRWRWLSWIPSSIGAKVYRWIANRRHKWWESQSCLIPDQLDRQRFLP